MKEIIRELFINRKDELIEAWIEAIETDESATMGDFSAGHQSWMSSFLHLTHYQLENHEDKKVFGFVESLVQKGYLSRMQIGKIVRIFQLFRQVLENLSVVYANGKAHFLDLNDFMDMVFMAVCRSYDERLVQSDEKFETLFDNADLVILNINIGGKIVTINNRGAKILRVKPNDIIDQPLAHFIYPEDLNILTRSFGHVLAGNPQIFAIRLKHNDGSTRYFDMTLTPVIEGGRITSMRAIARNVTRQMELQTQLAESEEKYRSLIENAGDAIFLISVEDGNILEANSLARKMAGLSREQIGNHSVVDLFDRKDEKEVIGFLQEAITSGHSDKGDLSFLSSSGSDIIVEVSSTAIEFGGNKVVQSIVKDTGAKKRIEKTLEEKNKRLVEAERAVYDLKFQLAQAERPSQISTLVLALIERINKEQKDRAFRNDALMDEETTFRLESIAQLMSPEIHGNDPVMVNINSLLERYVYVLEHINKDRLELIFEKNDIPNVLIAGEEFENVLSTLIINAIEASYESDEAMVKISTHYRGRMVTIDIIDSGPPSQPFEPKERFKYERTESQPELDVYTRARKLLEHYGGGVLLQGLPAGGNITSLFIPAQAEIPEEPLPDYQMVIRKKKENSEEAT